MPKVSTAPNTDLGARASTYEEYSTVAKTFHWLTVAFLLAQIPLGFYMAWFARKTEFADPSGQLYDTHKLIGFTILVVVVLRLTYRLIAGAPSPEPTIEAWHRNVSRLVHWAMYGVLLATPILGWLGASYYGALEPFGIRLPSLIAAPANDEIKAANEKFSEIVFEWHMWAASLLLLLVAVHVSAALYHHFLRKDNVLRRMWPHG